jgi:hypothetical protein
VSASTIGSVNLLRDDEKIEIYSRLIPQELRERFQIPKSFRDKDGNSLLDLKFAPGKTDVEMKLFHEAGFPDPILYGHLTDMTRLQNGSMSIKCRTVSPPILDICNEIFLPNWLPCNLVWLPARFGAD